MIGLVSDTHGLLRPTVLPALEGCDLILHAGDVGDPAILDALREVAPVVAIRGNVDRGDWARALPEVAEVALGPGVRGLMLHDLGSLDRDPVGGGFHVVVSGHSHTPVERRENGVLFVNPGSAGPRRFRLPVTLARLDVRDLTVEFKDVSGDQRA